MQTVWILGNQLSPEHASLAATNPRESRVLMVESKARGSALRYHNLKLVLVYSAMRHFAQDLRNAGWEVDYQLIEGTGTFEDGVRRHLEQRRPEKLVLAEPNSFPETDAVSKLGRKLRTPVEFVPTAQFLQSRDDFRAWASGQKRLLMENHYRRMRKRFGWLMEEDGQPAGGAWNFDPENRATYTTWKRAEAPRASTPLLEKPDQLTREVIAMLAREFPENPGRAEAFWLPVDRAGALRWLRYFIDERLPSFGVYEDMMAEGEPYLFHSVLSPLINLGLLTPRECVEAAIEAYRRGTAPLNSAEGYVRQMIGWREFINGVYWLRAGIQRAELVRRDAAAARLVLHLRDADELPASCPEAESRAGLESPHPAAHGAREFLSHLRHQSAGITRCTSTLTTGSWQLMSSACRFARTVATWRRGRTLPQAITSGR